MAALRYKAAAVVATALILAVAAAAQSAPAPSKPDTTPSSTTRTAPATPARKIVVSLEDHKLALMEDGQVKKVYTVAVGKPSTPSPVGSFTIARRVANPTYSHDGRVVPPGPHNPVGSRWMGLSIKGYGIHGTNEPRSIGKASSHGCIRMAKTDLEELYPQVAVGTEVELIGQRDEETAAIFGNPAAPAPNATELAAAHSPAAANTSDANSEPVKTAAHATPAAPVAGAL